MNMWNQMGIVAKCVAFVLFFMSMWSFGVAIERIFTFTQARNQSKMYAPQVAKHLKEGRLKDAIALSSSKNYRYSHLAKVVLAGLQEYQFQQETGSSLTREDLMDTVRRSIQRAAALTAADLKKGVAALATIGSTAPFVGLLGTVVDVMLVLLIIMMLVAPLLQQGVAVKLPTAANTVDKPETQDQTVVAIGRNKELYVNARPVTEAEMTTRINEILENKKEKIVLIK